MSSGSGANASSDIWCLEDDIIDIVSSAVQCTCRADGRAHKKELKESLPWPCPFPPPGNDVRSSPVADDNLQPPADKCSLRRSCKAPPAKGKKA